MGGRGAKVAGPTVSLMIGCSSNVWNGGGCGRIHSSVRHVLHPALRERPARLSRRADADTGSAGAGERGSGMEGERDGGSAGSVTSGFPYPGVSRSGLRRGRTRALLARPRFSAMGKSVWRRPRPRHGHDPDKRAPPRYPAARIHTTCASGALPSPGRRASGDAPLPPPPPPVHAQPSSLFARSVPAGPSSCQRRVRGEAFTHVVVQLLRQRRVRLRLEVGREHARGCVGAHGHLRRAQSGIGIRRAAKVRDGGVRAVGGAERATRGRGARWSRCARVATHLRDGKPHGECA